MLSYVNSSKKHQKFFPDFAVDSESLLFRVGKNPRQVTHVCVILNETRTKYTILFFKMRQAVASVVAEAANVRIEQLNRTIARQVGLLPS